VKHTLEALAIALKMGAVMFSTLKYDCLMMMLDANIAQV
jgi:hypothetical protein